MDFESETTFVVIRCVSLKVNGKAITKHAGMFSNILMKVSGSTVAKNEKRIIKLSQSEPFKPTGRPPKYFFFCFYVIITCYLHSLLYIFIYLIV
jgi:hypothetical protein